MSPRAIDSILLKSGQHYGLVGGRMGGPTLGSLQDAIMSDAAIGGLERRLALSQLRSRTGGMPASTPITDVILQLGGGALGYMIARYFSMGPVGQALSAVAGYGIGRAIAGMPGPRDPWADIH